MNEQIERYFLGKLTFEQKDELFKQITENPESMDEFARLQNTWALTSSSYSENDYINARTHLRNFRKRMFRRKIRVFAVNTSKYAAILAVGMFISWFFYHQQKAIYKTETVFLKLTVPAGQRSMLTLSDGTTVWVNAQSTLEYPGVFSGKTREVILNGEAYFDVAPDPEQPFIVKSGNFNTKVTGTHFNIFAYKDYFDVSLVEGQVKIFQEYETSDTVILNHNERIILEEGRLIKKLLTTADDFLWKDGIYHFNDMPFREIVKKLELYYDVRIHVENKPIMTRRVTGKFRQRDGIETVLKLIQVGSPFSFYRNEDSNTIYIL